MIEPPTRPLNEAEWGMLIAMMVFFYLFLVAPFQAMWHSYKKHVKQEQLEQEIKQEQLKKLKRENEEPRKNDELYDEVYDEFVGIGEDGEMIFSDECPSCCGDLVTSTARDKNGNVVYTDVCSQCGYEHEEIEWHSYPYEMVGDDVIAQMQAKYPNEYPRKFGSLYIATKDFGCVKRGMVGKLYWSKSSPKSSDGIEFVLENGEKNWNRWVWDDVIHYEPIEDGVLDGEG